MHGHEGAGDKQQENNDVPLSALKGQYVQTDGQGNKQLRNREKAHGQAVGLGASRPGQEFVPRLDRFPGLLADLDQEVTSDRRSRLEAAAANLRSRRLAVLRMRYRVSGSIRSRANQSTRLKA